MIKCKKLLFRKKNNCLNEQEYKLEVKSVLKYFHDFCNTNNIQYYIAAGSLLGTIRHHGFIPWDDDVDVYMRRKDYDKLILLSSKLKQGFYILSSSTSKYYYNNFARFCHDTCFLKLKGVEKIDNLGTFVDIFPLDIVPEDATERAEYFCDIKRAKEDIMYSLPITYYFTCSPKRIIKYILNIPRRVNCRFILGTKKLKKKRDELMQQYNNRGGKLYANLFDAPGDMFLIKEEEITSIVKLPFEDICVNVPIGYDSILTRQYGDYMTPPPISKRLTHHHFRAFWNDGRI